MVGNVGAMRPAWEPSESYLERSRLRRFARANGHSDYATFFEWSIRDLEAFWRATEQDLGIVWHAPYAHVLDSTKGIPWTTWWTGGRMNYVATALRHDPARVAVIAEAEEGTVRTLTFGELAAEVASVAAGLRSLGVRGGDRVGVFLPLTIECAVAVLAIGAIGAVFIPIFSGYGAEAIAGRLRDAEARALICADGFYRRGQVVPMKETADAAADAAPSVDAVVVVERVGRAYAKRGRDVPWSELRHRADLDIADTSAEDPFMVIYTSGTTGKPKGALHVHGGFPVKAAQDLAHCFDLQERDVILWSTDIGWMMGPWLITGGLMLGATIVLFDGPCPGMAADVVDEQGRPVRGAVGELVIRKPWPGMTRGFWRDPHTSESRYLQTYWSRIANVWVHGDWARIDEEGFWYIEGRSDDTLKVAGKRVGPAEVESAAVAHPAVSEAAAIGVPHEIKGEVIVVFVVPRPLHAPTPELARSVQDKIAEILGKPLRPEAVRFVTQLPKTRNAKILRRVIRGAYLGKTDLGDLSSLENPAAVDEVRSLARS